MQWSVTINSDLGRHKWGSNLKEPIQQKKYIYNHGQIRCSSLKNPACDYFSTIIRHFTPAKVKVLILAWISDGSDNGNSVFGIHTLFVALWIIFKYTKKSYYPNTKIIRAHLAIKTLMQADNEVPEIFRIPDSSLAFTNMEYENEIHYLVFLCNNRYVENLEHL